MRLSLVAAITLVGLFSAGCLDTAPLDSGPQAAAVMHQPGPLLKGDMIPEADLKALGLRPYWNISLQMLPGDAVRLVRLFDSQLIVLTWKNMVYSVDSASGQYKPLAQVDLPDRAGLHAPVFDGARYFFAGKNEIIGLNARTLTDDVKINLEMPASCAAASDKKFVYSGALDGRVFAYNIDSQVLHWQSKVASAVTGLAVLDGNIVVCRSNVVAGRGELVAFKPGQKYWSEVWQRPVYTEGPVSAPIVVSESDHSVFAASEDRSVYKFNGVDGWVDWRCRTPGKLLEPPTLLANALVQRITGSGTWLIDRASGQPIWKDAATLHYLGQADNRMYFFDGKELLCKEAASGRTLGKAPVQCANSVMVAPNPDQSRLYLITTAGQITCANDIQQPYLTVESLKH
ncbi:MAG: hypothetical protein BIFFINMI_01554 [Phycisphaerae bacterium]|nr:hypothetical protein [Phycisphaerae bacterium]